MVSERTSHLTQTGRGEKEKRKEEEIFGERSSTLSLVFPAIKSIVSGGARGKAHPRGKSFATRPKSRSFDKLQEVGFFSYLV